MSTLKQYYIEALPARITALEAARTGLDRVPAGRAEHIDSVRRISHYLKGSAALYELPQISTLATRVETCPEEDLTVLLDRLLNTLKDAVDSQKRQGERILIVDDAPEIARFEEAALRAPHRQIDLAETGAAAEQLLQKNEYSIILLDLVLPDTDGRNLLIKIRERVNTAVVPVFVLSATLTPNTTTECYAMGADAVFAKPVDPSTLSAAVSAALQRARENQQQSRQDRVTGLPNRAAFVEALTRACSFAARNKERLAIGKWDFDNFSKINADLGSVLGSKVLRQACDVVAKCFRRSDFVARWGGDEFVVLFPETDAAGAASAMKKALQTLQQTTFQPAPEISLQLTFSAGVADIPNEVLLEEAATRADQYVYEAKVSGRNRVCSPVEQGLGANKSILFAEDDCLTASLVRHRLEREGFSVIHVDNGPAAVNAFKNSRFSLAVLDVKMPGMDGFEVLAQVRKLPGLTRIPIMMLTALGGEKDIIRGLNLGANEYMLKPFSPQEVVARVRRLLKR